MFAGYFPIWVCLWYVSLAAGWPGPECDFSSMLPGTCCKRTCNAFRSLCTFSRLRVLRKWIWNDNFVIYVNGVGNSRLCTTNITFHNLTYESVADNMTGHEFAVLRVTLSGMLELSSRNLVLGIIKHTGLTWHIWGYGVENVLLKILTSGSSWARAPLTFTKEFAEWDSSIPNWVVPIRKLFDNMIKYT